MARGPVGGDWEEEQVAAALGALDSFAEEVQRVVVAPHQRDVLQSAWDRVRGGDPKKPSTLGAEEAGLAEIGAVVVATAIEALAASTNRPSGKRAVDPPGGRAQGGDYFEAAQGRLEAILRRAERQAVPAQRRWRMQRLGAALLEPYRPGNAGSPGHAGRSNRRISGSRAESLSDKVDTNHENTDWLPSDPYRGHGRSSGSGQQPPPPRPSPGPRPGRDDDVFSVIDTNSDDMISRAEFDQFQDRARQGIAFGGLPRQPHALWVHDGRRWEGPLSARELLGRVRDQRVDYDAMLCGLDVPVDGQPSLGLASPIHERLDSLGLMAREEGQDKAWKQTLAGWGA